MSLTLDRTTMSLQAKLDISASVNIPQAIVHYYDVPLNEKMDQSQYQRSTQYTTLSSSADFTICDAPTTNGWRREIVFVSVVNKNASAAVVTIKLDDSAETAYVVKSIAQNTALCYEDKHGFYTL